MVKKVGKYELGRTIGEGTFAKVKFAINKETGDAVAIKILDKEKIYQQNMGDQIKKEIAIMKLIKHPNVVQMYEVLASKTKIFIVLELVRGGELFDQIVSEGKFDEKTANWYFRQLVDGVQYCHDQGVCHRDLKPENLLIGEKDKRLKISDFGLSVLYHPESQADLLHTTCGTPNYVAPEVLADKGYDGTAADVWSMGVILYVLLAGYLPFDEPTHQLLFKKVSRAEYACPRHFSPEAKAIIGKILVADPKTRATIEDIRNDPWFTKYHADEPMFAPPRLEVDQSELVTEFEESEYITEDGDSKQSGPVGLNAFELISLCGGMDLNLMFESGPQIKRSTRFTSSQPPEDIIRQVSLALKDLRVQHKLFAASFKIKARTNPTAKGRLSFVIQVICMVPGLYIVEVRRGKGDGMEFYNLYRSLIQKLGPLVETPSSAAYPAA
jgi:serine/threonine protein kinase